ncbi:MAG: OmpA family protein [Candidatus Thiodiazotropha lotti]|uniref:Cell envelope biogenesis protein OmpA n=1 Tax=Candidatus Thiodiazotropha endoloripes TaxID=1818881 RepID=A0A1E2UP05_9GAMM|nr:OmpA family protein [Candidatus Thiodiazotropha endoloripes]MCG7899929.1 OmpA family protein [Candidatus Thiodiazotropha weberae]MCG7993397.1 OmpA family protein [Candidatus Thiodiazotropha lotti]MCG7901067.1 OmpA family protein [Candidatus Thiodiazotropha weberae]MCG7913334.1 OmpA family protein [Candidatus Thiodiazotropha weberae]MCG7998085.1 OmpA family protein [Candidatus Thiodiazotropha lotti]
MTNKIVISCLLAALIILQACTTVDPYSKEEKTSKATTGAVIGAVAGAVIGIATSKDKKKRKERALKGAGIGAIAGGGVGYYMDVQEAKLRQRLENTGVSVTREGDNIILNLPGNITFEVDKTDVKADFVEILDSVALVLNEYKSTMIEVAGHTDSTGSESYNQRLSQQRAQSVSEILNRNGVAGVRIDTVGYGESQPIASNGSAAGRQQNRRVELTLLPYVES